jgi:hypothetical protein
MAFTRRNNNAANIKEAAFIAEYIQNGYNGTQAYAKVFKVENLNGAACNAHKILQRSTVLKELERQQNLFVNKSQYSKGKLMSGLAMIADSNIADYIIVGDDGRTYIQSLKELPVHIQKVIKKIKGVHKVRHIKNTDAKVEKEYVEEDLLEIELWDKMEAKRLIGKELGMFTDVVKHTGADGKELVVGIKVELI